jgi:diaminopimelate epimerase
LVVYVNYSGGIIKSIEHYCDEIRKQMRVPYSKMHGTGNLILIVDQRVDNLPPPSADSIRELGAEGLGPGFDQMMWVGPASDETCIASYRVFNADGSEVEQCGNGVRCVAKHLAGVDDNGSQFSLQSPAGIIEASVFEDGQVAVSMGEPQFEPERIPFLATATATTYLLDVAGENIEISAVSMGNPHAVLRVADVSAARVGDLGPEIEHHQRFPELTNVGFMCILDRQHIDLRVHERGVGETAACGTGACAAVVSGQRRGLLGEEVRVHLPGGQVVVSWRGSEAAVWLKGNAELISEGMMDLQE